MAINLTKGQRVDIGLQKLGVGLGWDSSTAPGVDFDLDLSAFLIAANQQIPTEKFIVFYNNLSSPDGAAAHTGDDLTGDNSEDGDDETINVDLSRLDPRIDQIIFTATIYEFAERKQNFGQARNSYIRIYDSSNDNELCRYELDEDFSVETSVEFGRLYKRNDAWRFEAIGDGYQGGLEVFVKKYASAFAG
jgi:tellurium resistance protein TerD